MIAAAAVMAAAGCSWSTSVDTLPRPCEGSVEVTITPAAAGTPERFSWTPACGFRELRITAAGPGADQIVRWQLSANSSLIVSGVQYGVPQPGVDAYLIPVPLVAGQTYQIELVPIALRALTRMTWVHR